MRRFLNEIRDNYISAAHAAARLRITPRRVAKLAQDGRIPGAIKISETWLIPKNFSDPRLPRGRPSIFNPIPERGEFNDKTKIYYARQLGDP